VAAPPEIAVEEQRLALARVLDSRTFSRSDQLRAFLRYVCEAAFAGRAHELNEYALGVSVLGRRAGYSPAEDSGVRTRAYELRNKLKAYYRDEAPDDPIQIEIEKGAYVPRFHRRAHAAPEKAATAAAPESNPAAAEQLAPPAAAPVLAPPPGTGGFAARWGVAALALGVVLAIVSGGLLWSGRAKPVVSAGLAPQAATPEMLALWRPFLATNVPLLITFEVRLFFYAPATGLVVRDAQTNQVAEAAQSKPLTAFQERMGTDKLIETYDYADVGSVQAAFLLGRLLNHEAGLKYASALGWQDVLNSNVIFVGKSNVNPTIARVLRDANLDFVDSEFGASVRNRHPQPGESAEYRHATTHGAGKKFGVITVLPGPQPGRHMMILTGSGAELMWALAQSVADPARVKELMSHVMTPSGDCPAAFQVLIEATFESNVPINTRYVTHHVYDRPK
jgi:hypothetical protein